MKYFTLKARKNNGTVIFLNKIIPALALALLFCRPSDAFASSPQQHTDPGKQDFTQRDTSVAPDLKTPTFFFGRPKMKTAATQLEYAQSLEKAGKYKKARKAYDALVHEWSESEEAAVAQLGVAEMMERTGRYDDAFREYQYLLDYYLGFEGVLNGVTYNDIIAKQFAVVNTLRANMDSGIIGTSGAKTVVSMYMRIVNNAPQWERAPECMVLAGLCYEETKKFLEAFVIYEELASRYPLSENRSYALHRAAYCRYKLSEELPRDERTLKNAIAAAKLALQTDKKIACAEETFENMKKLSARFSAMNFEKAKFYDKVRKNPQAAIVAYTQFVESFPYAAEAQVAHNRINELRLLVPAVANESKSDDSEVF